MYKNLKKRACLLKKMLDYLHKNKEQSKPDDLLKMYTEYDSSDDRRGWAIFMIIMDFAGHDDWKIAMDALEDEMLLVDEAYHKLIY